MDKVQKTSMHDLKVAFLAVLGASPRALNKSNMIGRPHQRGDLEFHLGVEFSPEERALAARAFDELRSANLIQPTFSDIAVPENWVVITDAGRDALKREAIDDLDEVLLSINPNLLEMRRGAWAALSAGNPDSIRQAAHSARELIDQVIKEGVSDEEIRSEPGFRPDPHSSSGITRRMRMKRLMRRYRGDVSDSDLKVAEEAVDFVLAIDDKLKAAAHSRSAPVDVEVRESLEIAEKMLRRLLVPPSSPT
jgi:hypothetical protein